MLARIPGQEILAPDALTNVQPLRDRGIVVVQGLLHEVLPRLALQVDLAVSLEGTTAQLANLCLKLRKS